VKSIILSTLFFLAVTAAWRT